MKINDRDELTVAGYRPSLFSPALFYHRSTSLGVIDQSQLNLISMGLSHRLSANRHLGYVECWYV
jgi:hypothetical protein